jgi:hypothetical protein
MKIRFIPQVVKHSITKAIIKPVSVIKTKIQESCKTININRSTIEDLYFTYKAFVTLKTQSYNHSK